MFSKSYKLKSTSTLKNTEKKHLSQRILESFSAATEAKVKELVSVKSNSNCLKLTLHSGNVVSVYTVENIPIMIDVDGFLVPTLCALWKVPDLVPTLTIHAPVLAKVAGGAPLYAPGVELPSGGALGFPMFGRGAPLAARTSDNVAAALVGRARLSSGDLLLASGGVVLDTIHVFGDFLCKEPKFTKIERPNLGPPSLHRDVSVDTVASDLQQLSIKSRPKEEWPQLVRNSPEPEPKPETQPPPCAPALIREPPPPSPPPSPCDEVEEDERDDCAPPENMDGLLEWCLLSALRAEGKRLPLPLLTNLLYRRHMVAQCPAGRALDLKKSSYKKMSKFLQAMQAEGVLEVREVERGVDAVTAVAWTHPRLRRHRGGTQTQPQAQTDSQAYSPPTVSELYCVTAALKPLLPQKKGSALRAAEVRAALTQYVRERGLAEGSGVKLDEPLAALLKRSPTECISWESLMGAALGAMTPCTELRFADGTVRRIKTKLQPVRMSVQTRSGNKKVTLVSNLAAFGLELQALGRECQSGAAAACCVVGDQLLLQGDQTRFVARLLTTTYGLPAKFVEGADKALAKK